MFILDNMNKEKLYNLLVNHITNEWSRLVSKDDDYERQISNIKAIELLHDYEVDRIKVLQYDQIRNKGRIDELNDLIHFIENIEAAL